MAGRSGQNDALLAEPPPGCRLLAQNQAGAPVPTVGIGLNPLDLLEMGSSPADSPASEAEPGKNRPIHLKVVPIQNGDDVIRARLSAREMARELGFVMADQIGIATAVCELSRNAYQYSGGTGKAVIRPVFRNHVRGIEIMVEDQGPGIPNLEQILEDGLSAGNAPGHGLRGSRHLMDEFEIESLLEAGTRVIIRKWLK